MSSFNSNSFNCKILKIYLHEKLLYLFVLKWILSISVSFSTQSKLDSWVFCVFDVQNSNFYLFAHMIQEMFNKRF